MSNISAALVNTALQPGCDVRRPKTSVESSILIVDVDHRVLYSSCTERNELDPAIAAALAAMPEPDVELQSSHRLRISPSTFVTIVPLLGGSRAAYALMVDVGTDETDFYEAARRYALSPREREIAAMLKDGAGTATISMQLGIGQSTVFEHIKHIRAKLDAHSRAEIVARLYGSASTQRDEVLSRSRLWR